MWVHSRVDRDIGICNRVSPWIHGCILLSQHIPLCVGRSLGMEVDIGGRVSEFPPVVEVS